jgi:glycosyltransferase 2 family protein
MTVRKAIFSIILFLSLIFTARHFLEFQKVTGTLQTADWRFVLLAMLFEVLGISVLGKTYQSIYRILGMKEDPRHMISLAAAANFVNMIAPSGGMSAVAMFLSDARRRGHPAARVTIANAIYLICEYIALLIAFSLGFVVLIRRNNLHWPEVIAASILLLGVVGLLLLLILAWYSTRACTLVLGFGFRFTNFVARPFLHRTCLEEGLAQRFAEEARSGMALLSRSSAPQLARPILFSLSNKLVLIGILMMVFCAFGVPFSPGTIIAGFSLGYLFVVVSPTPAGIGIVEGVLTLSLRSLGVPLEPAAIITLAFRGITLWEPFFIGGYLFRQVNQSKAS